MSSHEGHHTPAPEYHRRPVPGVADYLVDRLKNAGTPALFGLPGGGGNLELIEAAGRAGLPFVLTATETGSAIAAQAQAEITGAPGACLTTLGPGAASVVNGIAGAMLDRAPLLVITDSYAASGASFAHQRLDHRALLAPVTKWSGSLAPPRAWQNIDAAFDRLAELPPGPVHLDCPGDFEDSVESGGLGAQSLGWNDAIGTPEFQALISDARKPLLIVGLAARRPEVVASIRTLCETRGVPALVTYKAKGVVPDAHEWFGGVFTHGAIERPIVDESDLIIGIGFDPVEILPRPWTYSQPVVSIASWDMAEDHVPFRIQQVGHVDLAVDELARRLKPSEWHQATIRSKVDAARSFVRIAGGQSSVALLSAPDAVLTAAASLPGRGRVTVTVDAGAHMFPATMLWPAGEPNDLLISNGLSTMGFALPAAIGAGLTDRQRTVVALTGDAGLLICLGELATAVRERLRIIVIVFADKTLSLIELKQQARQFAPAGVALGDIGWRRIADGFGLASWSVTNESELEHAMSQAAAADGPALIEVAIDRSGYGAMARAIRG